MALEELHPKSIPLTSKPVNHELGSSATLSYVLALSVYAQRSYQASLPHHCQWSSERHPHPPISGCHLVSKLFIMNAMDKANLLLFSGHC